MKIHNCDKSHQYTLCGCQVKKFQSFSYQFNIHVGSILGEFFAYLSSICGPVLVKLWPPCYPLKMAEIGKKYSCHKKKLIIRLSKYIKTKSPLPFLRKLGYFLHFWVENRWASQVKWLESKFNASYFTQMVVDQLNPPAFSSFEAVGAKRHITEIWL